MQRVVLDKNNKPISLSLGANLIDNGCYFAIWSPDAKGIKIHIYDHNEIKLKDLELKERQAGVWFGFLDGVTKGMCYAIEALGEEDSANGIYNKTGRFLLDPYTKALTRACIYDEDKYLNHNEEFIPKSIIGCDDFDWQGVNKPFYGRNDLVLYETHVKGFSMLNEQIPEAIRGTYLGLAHPASIEHLKKLGITAVQLMPTAAFMSEPELEKRGLVNYWGYNPICYMAPDPRYASNPKNAVNEFKTMVRELHKNNIAVILDVVYNHTAEGGYGGPVLSFKGLMNRFFYAFERTQDGLIDYTNYTNVSGCGNSVFVDGRMVLNIVVDSLSYWLSEMQVDGFRFDLAATVNRENKGNEFYSFNANSAFFKSCFASNLLSQAIMIAEPWDIGLGGYRLGAFPVGWSEQNDRFRDSIRAFWRGDKGLMGEFATRLLGSRDIFVKNFRSINASLNYVSYHDGFTLHDVVTYNHKHNEKNGHNNTDGSDNNYSYNFGVEGETADAEINAKRMQAKRNLIATTILAQGIPHFVYGDEVCRTQHGNNNAYCQDNEISYMKWDFSQEQKTFMEFVSNVIKVRLGSDMLKELILNDDTYHLTKHAYFANWYRSNGHEMSVADWQNANLSEIMLCLGDIDTDEDVWCFLFNKSENDIYFRLPPIKNNYKWEVMVDTYEPTGKPFHFSTQAGLEAVCAQNSFKLLHAIKKDSSLDNTKLTSIQINDLSNNSCPVVNMLPVSSKDTVKNNLTDTLFGRSRRTRINNR